MAMIAHHTQVSHSILPSRPQLWVKEEQLRLSVSFHLVGRTCQLVSSTHVHQWRSQLIISRKERGFRVSLFKGNLQNDESERTVKGFRSSKKSVQLSLSQQEREDIIAESSDVTKNPPTFACENSGGIISSSSVVKEFGKCLILLKNYACASLSIDELQSKGGGRIETVHAHPKPHGKQAENLLKVAFSNFCMLDATIKLPLLTFPPFYLAVIAVYGTEVAKELMPLWILGPLIVAFYIMLIRGLCFLYVICFKLSKKLIINLPSYHHMLCEGKLKPYLQAHLWRPLCDYIRLGYKEFCAQQWMQVKKWTLEKRLDCIELVWPHYCRTIRFLRKAHVI